MPTILNLCATAATRAPSFGFPMAGIPFVLSGGMRHCTGRSATASWQVFTVNGVQPVVMSEPVCHVSYYEADAFARWSGARLPLETEWEVAASQTEISGKFLESGKLHPQPGFADPRLRLPRAESPRQFSFGDVWEWTASPYTAYPGFAPAAGALGEYNGQVYVRTNGAARRLVRHAPIAHSRDVSKFLPPAARWQFMGIRLAK